MENKQALKYSKKIKKIADKLLDEVDMMTVLSEYGKPYTTGSYVFDLMIEPDIDAYVISSNLARVPRL